MYGRNATGGAINVIPEHPRIGEFSGYATASYGNFNALTAEGAINVPLSEDGALRLSGTYARRDGYLEDGTSDDRTKGLRAQMMAHLTDTLTVRVAADYSHNGGYGYSVSYTGAFNLVPATGQYTFTPSNIPVGQGIYSPASQSYRRKLFLALPGRRLSALSPLPFQNNSFFGTNAEINWKTGIGTVTFIPAWRYSKPDYLADTAAFFALTHEKDEQYSGELRLDGDPIGPIDYILGLYYYNEKNRYQQAVDIFAQATWVSQRITTESWAPFARLTAHLFDRLRLVGGVRFTHDHKTFESAGTTGTIICTIRVNNVPSCPNAPLFPIVQTPSQLPFAFPPPGVAAVPLIGTGAIVSRSDALYNSHLTNSRVTYRAALEFDLTPHSLAYASLETGYRAGGFAAAIGHETYQPEDLTAYTLGLKNRFLGNRLQLNLEGFLWEYRDQQVNHVGLDSAGNTANFTENIGRSRIYGGEVEARALVTRTTLLSVDAQYLHAQNQSFVYTSGAQTPPVTGCPFALSGSVYVINCSNFPANNAPRWTINLAAQQTIPLGRHKAILSADTQYKSGRFINFAYVRDGGGYVDANWQSNVQASFGPADDSWSVAVFVRNLEGDRTPVFMSSAPLLNATVVGTSPPRTYGGRLSVKF